MADVTVFGADWCEDTTATRQQLDSLGVNYDYVNIDLDPEGRDWVLAQNEGKQRTPTLDVGGDILVEPNEIELVDELRRHNLVG